MRTTFDYIIAGGGLAGCVLAERLTADGTKRVLMLEAGRADYTNTFIRIPAGILRLFRSVYDWQHETGGEKACNGRNIFLQRGKVRRLNSERLTGPFEKYWGQFLKFIARFRCLPEDMLFFLFSAKYVIFLLINILFLCHS